MASPSAAGPTVEAEVRNPRAGFEKYPVRLPRRQCSAFGTRHTPHDPTQDSTHPRHQEGSEPAPGMRLRIARAAPHTVDAPSPNPRPLAKNVGRNRRRGVRDRAGSVPAQLPHNLRNRPKQGSAAVQKPWSGGCAGFAGLCGFCGTGGWTELLLRRAWSARRRMAWGRLCGLCGLCG